MINFFKTEIPLWCVFFIIFVHWIADFVCQSDWQAKNKSKSNIALVTHTGLYSLIWLPFLVGVGFNIFNTLIFILVTFIFHTIQDYITSRINTKLYSNNKVHEFFVSIGFDQVLHYIQLFITFIIFK